GMDTPYQLRAADQDPLQDRHPLVRTSSAECCHHFGAREGRMTSLEKKPSTRVLLANPAFTRDLDDGLERYMLGAGMRYPWSLLKRTGDRPRYAMLPLFLAYAAALLEQEGFAVRVIDGVPLNVREEEFLARVRESSPDVIFFEPNAAV